MMQPHDVVVVVVVVVVERKRKVVRTTAKWPKLVQCPTTRTPPPLQPLPILPDELILEILLRLPVRSLVQFRSVCNSWRTLISSSQFAKHHLQRSMADPTLTHPRCVYFPLLSSSHKMGIFSIQSLLENPSAPTKVVSFCRGRQRRVLGSCHGLLCLYERDYACKDSRAILWNPCTGLTCEWLEIGETGSVMSVHGFGYDHVHDKYKLFVVLDLISGGSVAKIFTFGANYWRTSQDFPFNVVDPIGVFVSGTLNWMCAPEEVGEEPMLASLDLGKETNGQLSLSERDADDDLWFTPALGVLRNCLAVGLDHKKTHWCVWVMKEYGVHQSWTKLVMIPHGPLDCKHSLFSLRPLYISENDVLLARASSSKSPWSKLVLCNLNSGRLDFPMIDSSSDGMLESPISELVGARTLLIYHESLVSPSQCGLRNRLSRMPLIKPSGPHPFILLTTPHSFTRHQDPSISLSPPPQPIHYFHALFPEPSATFFPPPPNSVVANQTVTWPGSCVRLARQTGHVMWEESHTSMQGGWNTGLQCGGTGWIGDYTSVTWWW